MVTVGTNLVSTSICMSITGRYLFRQLEIIFECVIEQITRPIVGGFPRSYSKIDRRFHEIGTTTLTTQCGQHFAWNRQYHYNVIKWKYFPRSWPFVREIHRSPVDSPHRGQWHWALMSSLICAWINGWANNWDTGDLRRNRAHYDVIVWLSTFNAMTSADIMMTKSHRVNIREGIQNIDKQLFRRWCGDQCAGIILEMDVIM